MEGKAAELDKYEADKFQINVIESRLKWIDQQLPALKGPLNFLKLRKFKQTKIADLKALEKLKDKNPVVSVETAVADAEEKLTKLNGS